MQFSPCSFNSTPFFFFVADAVMVKMSSFMPLSYMLVTANIFSFNDLMENLE